MDRESAATALAISLSGFRPAARMSGTAWNRSKPLSSSRGKNSGSFQINRFANPQTSMPWEAAKAPGLHQARPERRIHAAAAREL
jgi:hypothetical protein